MTISKSHTFLFVLMTSLFLYGFEEFFVDSFGEPILKNDDLVVQRFGPGICCSPTTMTFVGEDILVLQKSDGIVLVIKNGTLQEKPALDVAVNSVGERGMLGITSVDKSVYLYFTEAIRDGGAVLGNHIFRYDWNGEELVNGVLLKKLPSNSYHNGGAMVTGLDNQVYAVIGDTGKYGPLQNKKLETLFPEGTTDYMDTSVIFRVDQEEPYFAIGIRNSFGLAIDPINGNLWATENGDDDFDEINLVTPHFNSGWVVTMGPATESELLNLPKNDVYVYEDPKFSWEKVVAPTAISFASFKETDKFQSSVFVGDCITGNLYKFELNPDRDGFVFADSNLQDNVVNRGEQLDEIIFGTGFGCITDIETGPDGFLYIVSLSDGKIYRIMPKTAHAASEISATKSISDGGCLIATATFGSELAPQVQQLREIRDDALLQTESGSVFMNGFNQFYYSFSPTIADWERQNPTFRELVKLAIIPLVTSLSLLNYVDLDSEAQVLGYGIGIILMNVGMYFVAPVFVYHRIKNYF